MAESRRQKIAKLREKLKSATDEAERKKLQDEIDLLLEFCAEECGEELTWPDWPTPHI